MQQDQEKQENVNKHIEEYLIDYITSEKVETYATLLTGEWGCGKTTFITNFLKENKKKSNSFIY